MKTTVKLLLLVGLLVWTIVTAAITFAFLQTRDEIRGNTISIQQQLQKPQQLQKTQQLQKMKVLIKEQVESPQNEVSKTFQDLVYALGMVEVGTAYQDSDKRGLAGELGPLQITKAYWKDSGVPGRWEDCENWDYSVRVVKAYWERYAKQALKENDFEALARIHNGGPAGATKQATKKYWEKVKKFL